jgi:hypothetical protein
MSDISPPNATDTTQLRSHLSRRWVIKISIIAAGLIGFGVFGVYDALIGYPKRGANAAEALEFEYLQQLEKEGQSQRASVDDPQVRYAELRRKETEKSLTGSDQKLFKWLEQLDLIGKNDGPTATKLPRTDFRGGEIRDFHQRIGELQKNWTTAAGTPKEASPLSALDIPSQWAIVAAGFGIGGYMLFLLIAAKTKVYRWDPAEQRLTLPGGASFVPLDIVDFDKRKWHRLYITLKIRPTHPQLGGKDLTLDLLRFEPVEVWVLAMERTASPEADKASEKDATAATSPN